MPLGDRLPPKIPEIDAKCCTSVAWLVGSLLPTRASCAWIAVRCHVPRFHIQHFGPASRGVFFDSAANAAYSAGPHRVFSLGTGYREYNHISNAEPAIACSIQLWKPIGPISRSSQTIMGMSLRCGDI